MCVLGCEAIDRVDQGSEVPPAFKVGGFVLPRLLCCGALQDLGGGSVAIGPGIHVTQANVKDGPACTLPEVVGKDFAPGFIAKGG